MQTSFRSIASLVIVSLPSISSAAVNAVPLSGDKGFLVVIEARASKNSDTFQKCLGALVLPDVVVPAGHCLRGMKAVTVKIPKDESAFHDTLDGDFEIIRAKAFVAHPMTNGGYEGEMFAHYSAGEAAKYHDVGVILLSKPSKVAKGIKVAPSRFIAGNKADYSSFGFQRDDLFKYTKEIAALPFGQAVQVGTSENWFQAYAGTDRLACEADSGAPITETTTMADGQTETYFTGIQSTINGKKVFPKDMKRALAVWKKPEAVPKCAQFLTFFDVTQYIDWIEAELRRMDPKHPRKIPVAD